MIIPLNIGFMDWARSLKFDFNNSDMPLPESENKWQDWAMKLTVVPVFNVPGIPLAARYPNWREWAMEFYRVMN